MPLTRTVTTISLAGARELAERAVAEAARRQWTIAVAVVNPEGGLVLFQMMDGTQPGSEQLAILKARTSARMKRTTKVLEEGVAGGRPALLSLPGLVMLEGGVPIMEGGAMVGAIGISGMSSHQDGEIAAAALA
jgi:uncharacterized protein GlcG (DUF336 family)